MCAIAGGRGTRRALEIMSYRAPDGASVSDEHFSIGMGRLAILGETPFPFIYKDICVALNGQIYNWKELQLDLINLGHDFETTSDLEVVAHAFDEWGFDCLDHFNGMFAIAIRTKEGLFLARDIAGEKPLYYSTTPFRFASENKALFHSGTELPPGCFLWYTFKDGLFTVEKWWKFEPQEKEIKFDDACEMLELLLKDAITLRIPDKPYALYLSDGVDSTLISTYLEGAYHLKYFDDDYEEEFRRDLERIVWHLDYPIDSFSAFPLWLLGKQASELGMKVVMSGEGADELFSGYVRYVQNGMNAKARDMFPSYTSFFPDEGDLGWYDFNGKMQGLLRMGDRMAAAWSLENRCPFLDRRIIEFAFSLPRKYKAYGYDTKIILREILKKRKPDYVFEEKHGLYGSVNKWLGVSDPFDKRAYLTKQYEIWRKFL